MKRQKSKRKKRTAKLAGAPGVMGANSNIRKNEYQAFQRYQKNLLALKKHAPALADLVEQTRLNQAYELVHTAELPNLRHKPSHALYYAPPDSFRDAADQIKALKLKNTRLALFLGFGLGYQLIHYMQHVADAQNTNHILILEKDAEVFKLAMHALDLGPIIEHPRIKLLVGLPAEVLYPQMRQYLAEDSKYVLLKGIKPVYHLASLRIDKDYYLNALRAFKDSATHQILNFGNDPHDSLIGVENMLHNLKEIIFNPGVNLLYNKFKNRPAVVVATGPSLNKNKHLLKGLEDKALIIAADASLKVLLEMDLKPHLVTSLERVPEVAKLVDHLLPEQVEDVYLAACPVVRQEVYAAYPGPRLIVYRNFDHFKWLGIERGILDIKLSSGNMAFKLAEALGCNPIILIGQDLAFSRDMRTHAAGTAYGEKQDSFYQTETLQVPGNDGKPISTTNTWYSFLKAYELDLATYPGTCINSTEGGAYIQGTQVMPFQAAIDEHIQAPFYPLTAIKSHLSRFSRVEAERDFALVKIRTRETIQDLEEIIQNCKEGLALLEKHKATLMQHLEDFKDDKAARAWIEDLENQVNAYQKACGKSYQTYQLFLAHIIQSYNIRFRMEMIGVPEKYDNPAQARLEILLRQAEWFAVMGDLTQICLNTLKKANEDLKQTMVTGFSRDFLIDGCKL